MLSDPAEQAAELSSHESIPAFRLRYLLAVGLVLSVVVWAYPKGRAAWQLHNLAVTYSDYALCMVGPTGPRLLREAPDAFRELARRRLVASAPAKAPFQRCEHFVEKMPLEHSALRLHSTQAQQFAEYHVAPSAETHSSVDQLQVPVEPLEALAEEAWPFVRSGARALMKPSSHAKEAAHPSTPALPGVGSGLPSARHSYRSTAAFGDTVVAALGSGANGQVLISKNGGVNWERGGSRLAGEIRDRCAADDEGRAFTLSRMNDGQRIVLSHGPAGAPQVALLGPGEEKIAAIACDESALVAALVLEPDETGHRPVRLRLCPFRRPCEDIRLPSTGAQKLYYPVDVARMQGDTIVSRTSGGLTRVSSTRDEGRTWAPWVVAYDEQVARLGTAAPFRLLVVGDSLLLYAGASNGGSYPLLESADHGASFHAPLGRAPDDGASVVAER